MVRFPRLILTALAATFLSLSASATPIIRDATVFETFAIEGVSLDMAPEDAFNLLVANGYAAWRPDRCSFFEPRLVAKS